MNETFCKRMRHQTRMSSQIGSLLACMRTKGIDTSSVFSQPDFPSLRPLPSHNPKQLTAADSAFLDSHFGLIEAMISSSEWQVMLAKLIPPAEPPQR